MKYIQITVTVDGQEFVVIESKDGGASWQTTDDGSHVNMLPPGAELPVYSWNDILTEAIDVANEW